MSGGGAEYPREYPNLTPSQSDTTPKRAGVPPEKKDEGASSRGSQRGGSYEFSPRGDKRSGSNSYSRIQRGTDGNFVMSPARSSTLGRPGEFSGSGGFGFERGPRGVRGVVAVDETTTTTETTETDTVPMTTTRGTSGVTGSQGISTGTLTPTRTGEDPTPGENLTTPPLTPQGGGVCTTSITGREGGMIVGCLTITTERPGSERDETTS